MKSLKERLITLRNKVLTLFGFAAKAGRLSYGMEAAKFAVKSKKAKLVAVSDEISEKSRKEVAFFCNAGAVDCLILENFDINTVSSAIGRKCGIISVNDQGFADAILNALKGGNAYDK